VDSAIGSPAKVVRHMLGHCVKAVHFLFLKGVKVSEADRLTMTTVREQCLSESRDAFFPWDAGDVFESAVRSQTLNQQMSAVLSVAAFARAICRGKFCSQNSRQFGLILCLPSCRADPGNGAGAHVTPSAV